MAAIKIKDKNRGMVAVINTGNITKVTIKGEESIRVQFYTGDIISISEKTDSNIDAEDLKKAIKDFLSCEDLNIKFIDSDQGITELINFAESNIMYIYENHIKMQLGSGDVYNVTRSKTDPDSNVTSDNFDNDVKSILEL